MTELARLEKIANKLDFLNGRKSVALYHTTEELNKIVESYKSVSEAIVKMDVDIFSLVVSYKGYEFYYINIDQ